MTALTPIAHGSAGDHGVRGGSQRCRRHQARDPEHRARGGGHRDVVVETDWNRFDERRGQRGRNRGDDREGQRRQRRDRRPHPPGERDARQRAEHDERDRAGDRLLGVPREATTDERRARRARRERFFCVFCGFCVERRDTRPTSVAAPSPHARMPHAAATMSRRDGKVSVSSRTESGYSRIPSGKPRASSTGRYSRRPPIRGSSTRLNSSADCRERRRLPPRDHAQEQRERSGPDVDPLPRVLRMRGHECARPVRSPQRCITNRGDRAPDAVGERRHRVAEVAHRLAAVERPVVAEDLHRAARQERRSAEHRDPQLLGGAEHRGDRKRYPRGRPPPGELPDELEDAAAAAHSRRQARTRPPRAPRSSAAQCPAATSSMYAYDHGCSGPTRPGSLCLR